MVTDNATGSTCKYLISNSYQILSRGFHESYSLGKNVAGDDFPDDGSGANSHYGGRSIWGQIDAFMSRYHWTMDYVLWGISWANARLIIADAMKVDYKSKTDNTASPNTPHDIPDVIDLGSNQKNTDSLYALFGRQ